VHGWLLENKRRGHVHDGVRERGGGYRVVGEADERDPLPIDHGRDGRVRARDCGWQGQMGRKGQVGRDGWASLVFLFIFEFLIPFYFFLF
jgi:hypothetical protein